MRLPSLDHRATMMISALHIPGPVVQKKAIFMPSDLTSLSKVPHKR